MLVSQRGSRTNRDTRVKWQVRRWAALAVHLNSARWRTYCSLAFLLIPIPDFIFLLHSQYTSPFRARLTLYISSPSLLWDWQVWKRREAPSPHSISPRRLRVSQDAILPSFHLKFTPGFPPGFTFWWRFSVQLSPCILFPFFFSCSYLLGVIFLGWRFCFDILAFPVHSIGKTWINTQ